MAVIKCHDCGGQVSKSAKACPHCGAKVKKKVGVLGWLFVLFVVLPIAWSIGTNTAKVEQPAVVSSSVASKPALEADSDSSKISSAWKRSEYVDSMTDQKSVMLSLKSSNGAQFEFPYNVRGGSFLTLTFRNKGGDLDAYMVVDKGQMLCGIRDCKFSLRVGDGEVQTWTGLKSSTHDSDIMFIRDARQFERIVSSGVPIRIGLEFFQAGSRTFEFKPENYPGFN